MVRLTVSVWVGEGSRELLWAWEMETSRRRSVAMVAPASLSAVR
jgi:hypothetical protein